MANSLPYFAALITIFFGIAFAIAIYKMGKD